MTLQDKALYLLQTLLRTSPPVQVTVEERVNGLREVKEHRIVYEVYGPWVPGPGPATHDGL